jgi:predicted nucleic acid-binding protein
MYIGYIDPFISVVASTHHLTLFTSNTKHFERIINLGYLLRIDNWRNSQRIQTA